MKFQIYKNIKEGLWFWRLRVTNGKIIADSGEGYKNKDHCIKMVEKIQKKASSAKVQIL